MVPAIWNSGDATEGGLRGINIFVGKLREVEEDVEGTYGTQLALHFYDVEVEDSADPVILEEGKYTTWTKQSTKKGSSNIKMLALWEVFCKTNKLGALPGGLYDLNIRWEKTTLEFGEGMSPGTVFVPTELVEAVAPVKAAPRRGRPKSEEVEDNADGPSSSENVPNDAIVKVVMATVGEDGATRDIIRRDLMKKATLRTKMTAAGGLDAVLAYLVENGSLGEDEGFYFPGEVPSGGDADPFD